MNDNDFAVRIYCDLNLGKASSDMCVEGVLDAVKKLDDREQQTLEYYYRCRMTYKQVAAEMGISEYQARYSIEKAMRILRHPFNSRNMYVV